LDFSTVQSFRLEGTSQVKSIAVATRVKVSADGQGVVSHAGIGLLRELADLTGLSAQVTAALADTYRGPWVYAPGQVFADLAAAVADGADCIDGVGQACGDREHVFGAAASTTTMWRLVDHRIDAAHLPRIRAARAAARATAWTAGAAPTDEWLHIDIDATLVIDHSDNQQSAAPTWKKTFGHHPLLAFLDRPEIAGGEALAGPASLAFFLQICCVLALVFGAVNGVSYKGEPRCQYRKSVRE
jgi:hypothetical protein